MLRNKYGLMGTDPYRFVIDEREFPLSGELAVALRAGGRSVDVSGSPDSVSCKADPGGKPSPAHRMAVKGIS
ncbi:MAG: hypothetical protein HP493_14060, partial [Nitrospira sp.]|nr:hypothetical protein [Nitrospira sp.]